MRIDWWTLALQTINALVLIWLLSRVLFKPVADMIAERKAAAAHLLEEAEAAKAAALARESDARQALSDLADKRAAALAAVVAEAQKQKDALLAGAQAEAERLREGARADLERETRLEREARMAGASALAVVISRRLAQRLPASAQVAGFIEGLAGAAGAAAPETKADFDGDGPVRLKAPRALTAQEDAECRGALARAFGRHLDFVVEIDPEVIAGLELENAHVAIRNSLRADLARIAAAVQEREADEPQRPAP
ncbi:F0F1 ATP synthase subunit B [Methylocystis sp. IM3]|uniref:F0F1 ATP synthase subunit B family protein n=1 Tax=unclassified Methylocystis TaxID=2625913 RepID=UPI0030F945FB